MKIIANKIWLVFLFICFYSLNAVDIGSDFTIQSHIVFNYGEDNRIANDAVMENGFTLTARTEALSDSVATCSFDSYFPVQGLTNLNGGYLNLNNNIIFKDIFALGSVGKVFGNGFSITFPSSANIAGVPSSADRCGRLHLLAATGSLGGNVNSLDWSFDDKYILLAKVVTTGYEEAVYFWDGQSLSEVGGLNFSDNNTCGKWHPSAYYFAFTANTSTAYNFYVYEFIPQTNTFTRIYAEIVGTGVGRSVAWSPNGKYLAVNHDDETLRVYSFDESSTNTVSFVDSVVYETSSLGNDVLDWNLDSTKIVFGITATTPNLYVCDFDGTSVTISTSLHIPGVSTVRGVSWNKNILYKDLIVAIPAGVSDGVTVYSYKNNWLTKVSGNGVADTFYSCSWSVDGTRVFTGTASAVYVYYFNPNTNSLSTIYDFFIPNSLLNIRGSHDNKYIASVDSASNSLNITEFQQNYMLFDNTNLVFNSDAEFIVTTTFSGLCTINGNGHKIYLNEDGSFNIAAQSQLKLQNLELVNLKQNNLQCLADDSQIIFEDCILTITSNYAFETGSILFLGDVEISGTSKFTYSSSSGSTIDSFSTLKINSESTFNYAPSIAKRDLIYMNDDTSSLYLDNCTIHSTTTGLRLTRGKLFIQNLVTLNSDGSALSESICFGNGTADDDLDINILAHADLEVYGTLEYKNTN